MTRFTWIGVPMFNGLSRRVAEEWFVFRLTLYSLFYNSLTSLATVMETAIEPMFWIVDNLVRYLGPIFVFMVVILTTSVVVIFYTCLLPEKMAESYWWTAYHLVFGHWLLINVVFHYFKAAFTNPGYVPENIPEVVGVCKKCIAPKAPRSHHCSVCDKCILKMDHHCPWLNNCVGHYNHRYFFLYTVYMWIACLYVCLSAYPVFITHVYGDSNKNAEGWPGMLHPFYLLKEAIVSRVGGIFSDNKESDTISVVFSQPTSTLIDLSDRPEDVWVHMLVFYEFMLCSAASIALFGLSAWHLRLILYSETSIEIHTNRAEMLRQAALGKKFLNPYNFGTLRNLKLFLGLTHGRTFWRHVLLPSSHAPEGNGLVWRSIHNYHTDPEGILVL